MNANYRQRAAAENAEESEMMLGPKIDDFNRQDSDSDSDDHFVDQKSVVGQKRKINEIRPVLPSIAIALEEPDDTKEEEEGQEEEEEGEEEEEEESMNGEKIISEDEATRLLGILFDAHTERTQVRKRSAILDKKMKECKKFLVPFMHKQNHPRLGSVDDGKYFNSKYKEKNRGIRKNDLIQMIERDYGVAKRQQYERELATLAKRKIRILDNRITYIGMRVAGERNPGAAPPRVRPGTKKEGEEEEEEEEKDK